MEQNKTRAAGGSRAQITELHPTAQACAAGTPSARSQIIRPQAAFFHAAVRASEE